MARRSEKLTLVVVGAHPDDIVCVGPTAAKYSAEGHKVYSLSVTLGETIRKPGPEQEHVKILRRDEGIEIAEILGAEFVYMDVPCNKIIPTMEMKMKLVSILRKLGANILLVPTPWDCHADHRNLSWTMRDVIYYVGHQGIKADYPPCKLKAAYMYELEIEHNELHAPDFLVDGSSRIDTALKAIMSKKRADVFGRDSNVYLRDIQEAWWRFWGMRYGVKYADPYYFASGSMATTDPGRKLKVQPYLPLIE